MKKGNDFIVKDERFKNVWLNFDDQQLFEEKFMKVMAQSVYEQLNNHEWDLLKACEERRKRSVFSHKAG